MSSPNLFQNFDGSNISNADRSCGIYAHFTSVNIVNSRFINIGKTFSSDLNFGIFARLNDGVSKLTLKGFGGTTSSITTFEKVSCPFRVIVGNTDIRDVYSKDSRLGAYYETNSVSPTAATIEFRNCLFEEYSAGGVFINLSKRLIRKLVVNNCQFIDSGSRFDAPPVFGFDRYGLLVFASQLNPIKECQISGNTFSNENKNLSTLYRTGGVFLRNIKYGLIENNNVFDNDALNTFNKDFKGFRLEHCTGLTVRDNSVYGSPGAFATNKTSTGIDIFESGANRITCNFVNNLRTGIGFAGENCDHTSFSKNRMSTHANGLLLAADAIIGAQIKQDNRWHGPAPLEGNFAFTGFDPFDPSHIDRVQMSKFEINTSDQNNVLWANPRIIGAEPDNDYWFEYNPVLPPPQYPQAYDCGILTCCAEEDDEFSEGDILTLNGNFPPYKGFPASGWEAELRLYQVLDNNPALRPTESPAETWYAAKSTTNLAQLFSAYTMSTNAGNDPALLDQMSTSGAIIDALLAQLYAKDAQITQTQSPSEEAQFLTERLTILNQLETELVNFTTLGNTILETIQLEASAAGSNLSSLTSSNIYEQNLKAVLQIQLDLLASGLEISTSQHTSLQSIASQCRYEGGIGVLMARLMLDGASYDDNEICIERSKQQVAQPALSARLMPNPASEKVLLQIGKPFSEGRAKLYDTFGKVVAEYSLSGPETYIFVEGLSSGVYFLVVSLDQEVFSPLKLAVQR
ncbi:MAG: T9SS type A sorting domain-containing protein [Saprospiraceae bacterium]